MKELLKNKKLILQYVPGNGAWTYHLVIPDTKGIKGKWGFMKVSGTIDDYKFKNLNIAPITDQDKRIFANGEIRKAIGKGGGDEVTVTMYKTTDNRITDEFEVKDCLKDANVYDRFTALSKDEQKHILKDILSQQDEDSQEKKIVSNIKKLSTKK